MSLSHRQKIARDAVNACAYSRKDIAQRAGISLATLNYWYHGQHEPCNEVMVSAVVQAVAELKEIPKDKKPSKADIEALLKQGHAKKAAAYYLGISANTVSRLVNA